jgi:hypothetical protein
VLQLIAPASQRRSRSPSDSLTRMPSSSVSSRDPPTASGWDWHLRSWTAFDRTERQTLRHQSLIGKLQAQDRRGDRCTALQVPPEQVSLRRRQAGTCKPDQQCSRGAQQRTGLREGEGSIVRVGDTDGDAAAVPEPDGEADGLGEGALEFVTLPDAERDGLWRRKAGGRRSEGSICNSGHEDPCTNRPSPCSGSSMLRQVQVVQSQGG